MSGHPQLLPKIWNLSASICVILSVACFSGQRFLRHLSNLQKLLFSRLWVTVPIITGITLVFTSSSFSYSFLLMFLSFGMTIPLPLCSFYCLILLLGWFLFFYRSDIFSAVYLLIPSPQCIPEWPGFKKALSTLNRHHTLSFPLIYSHWVLNLKWKFAYTTRNLWDLTSVTSMSSFDLLIRPLYLMTGRAYLWQGFCFSHWAGSSRYALDL